MNQRSTTMNATSFERIANRYYNQHHKYLDRDQLCTCTACTQYRQLTKRATNDNPRTDV